MGGRKKMLKVSKKDGAYKIMVETDMTIYSAAKLKQALAGKIKEAISAGKTPEVDLSKVGEMDSAGFQILVAGKKQLSRARLEMTLLECSPSVNDVLQIYNMEAYFGNGPADEGSAG